MRPTLHLLMGLPGAGKTTLAKTLQDLTKASRLSSDDYRIAIYPEPSFSQKEHDNLYSLLDHSAEHLLAAGRDVIYDANLNRLHHRKEKYTLAKKYNAKVVLWWVKVPEALARNRRITEQNHTLIPDGETAEKMFDRIAAILEEPTKEEKVTEIDGRDVTKATVSRLLKTSNQR